MDIIGKVVEIGDTERVTDRFKKRSIVLEYAQNPEYPEYIKFEFVQDRVDLLDKYKVGQEVQVFFDLRGRKWEKNGNTSYFNTLQGWRIQSTTNKPPVNAPIEESVAEEVPF